MVIILFGMTLTMFVQADHQYGYTLKHPKEKSPILSDGVGYYAYLPQYFIYKDQPNFQFLKELVPKYEKRGLRIMFFGETDNVKNKFFVGTSVLQFPFFYVAHVLHQWNGWDADGYEVGYRFAIQMAALFYWLLGAIAFLRLFQRLGFSRISILMTLAIVTFGTNLNMFTAYWPSMSHTYSFAMIACFLNVAHHWSIHNRRKELLIAFLLLGLIFIIRPVNVIVILIVPFFFASFKDFINRVKLLFTKQLVAVSGALVLAIIPLFIQLFIVHDQTGHWGINNYPGEGFDNVWHPEFFNVLFSFHKGFFIYAPGMLLIFVGLFFQFKQANRYFFLGWCLTVFVWLYVIASWWCWDYGGGLGMRAMIEVLPLFAFALLYLFKYAQKWLLILSIAFASTGIYVYQFFQYQYNMDIIDCCVMTQNDFWNVFMTTDKRYQFSAGFNSQRDSLPTSYLYKQFEVEFYENEWHNPNNLTVVSTEKLDWLSSGTLKYWIDTTNNTNLGKLIGEVKLNDPDINPFFTIEYYSNEGLIEQQLFTIGSNIDHPMEFEEVVIEINHTYDPSICKYIAINIHGGGGEPIWKNLKFIKLYE